MAEITMKPIGYVGNSVREKKDDSWGEDVSVITLNDEFNGGLTGLSDFSHAIIVYYLDKADYIGEEHLLRRPRNQEDMPLVGIFSQRAKNRPNRIGITTVRIMSVSDKELTVVGLDAVDGTGVLDIKPYYPIYDRKDATVPEWVDRLMKGYF